jgi:hypothetical protein
MLSKLHQGVLNRSHCFIMSSLADLSDSYSLSAAFFRSRTLKRLECVAATSAQCQQDVCWSSQLGRRIRHGGVSRCAETALRSCAREAGVLCLIVCKRAALHASCAALDATTTRLKPPCDCTAQLPEQLLKGSRIVELGAGPGLPGLYAASAGANVTITDLDKVVPLIQENIRSNREAFGADLPAARARLCGWQHYSASGSLCSLTVWTACKCAANGSTAVVDTLVNRMCGHGSAFPPRQHNACSSAHSAVQEPQRVATGGAAALGRLYNGGLRGAYSEPRPSLKSMLTL